MAALPPALRRASSTLRELYGIAVFITAVLLLRGGGASVSLWTTLVVSSSSAVSRRRLPSAASNGVNTSLGGLRTETCN